MTGLLLTIGFVGVVFSIVFYQVVTNLIYICSPNEVLVFSGGAHISGDGKRVGYRIVKGGRALRRPFLETVDRLDLTNMNIEVKVRNAFSKGGIPLNIDGIANVKIAGNSPGLDNALQRLLGKPRPLVMRISKETLEGYLRGVLATLTPEEVNEDTQQFEKELRHQATDGFDKLGLTLDNLKIQSVNDDQGYLTAMGRIKSAELNRENRVAEASRRAESLINQAENRQQGELAKIKAALEISTAEADRRVANAQSKQLAWVAEQQSEVKALLTRATAEVHLQEARIEQARHQLVANVIEPSKADMEARIAEARGDAAPILENGRAQAEALRALAKQWHEAGANAKDVFLLQKLEAILPTFLQSIRRVRVDNVTMLQGMGGEAGGSGLPAKAVATVKALEAGGIDIGGLLARLSGGEAAQAGAQNRASVGLQAPQAEPPRGRAAQPPARVNAPPPPPPSLQVEAQPRPRRGGKGRR